jgi:putative membrane protein
MLLRYYLLLSLLSLVAFPFVFVPLYLRYRTLSYRFDERGVSASWGVLNRKEVVLTYRRVQDIHVTRNLLQRWLGLAVVGLQTASGSAGPGITIEGVRDPERLRDHLYRQMRGAHGEALGDGTPGSAGSADAAQSEVLALLREIRDDLRQVRAAGSTGQAQSTGQAEPADG